MKSDLRDLAAMVEMMARGAGRESRWEDGPMAVQAVWSAHRRRKVRARVVLQVQMVAQLDLVVPGLGDCFKDVLAAKSGGGFSVIVPTLPGSLGWDPKGCGL